jgi:hypothetical protein
MDHTLKTAITLAQQRNLAIPRATTVYFDDCFGILIQNPTKTAHKDFLSRQTDRQTDRRTDQVFYRGGMLAPKNLDGNIRYFASSYFLSISIILLNGHQENIKISKLYVASL